MLKAWFKWIFLGAVLLVLSGCATGASPNLGMVLQKRTITSVEVSLAADADIDSIKSLDGSSDRDKAPSFMAEVQRAIETRLASTPQGGTPTKLKLTITQLAVATREGNVLGSATVISGVADLHDPTTGEKLASLGNVGGMRTTSSPLIVGIGGAILREVEDNGKSQTEVASENLANMVVTRMRNAS